MATFMNISISVRDFTLINQTVKSSENQYGRLYGRFIWKNEEPNGFYLFVIIHVQVLSVGT